MSLKISKNSKNRNEERKVQNNEKVTSESRRNRRRSRERSVTRLNRLGGREHHRDRVDSCIFSGESQVVTSSNKSNRHQVSSGFAQIGFGNRRLGFSRNSYTNGFENRSGQFFRGNMPRNGRGIRDNMEHRLPYGRTDRRSQRFEIRSEATTKENSEKPVMNLFDPCKVPTGKSYFTHDDRTNVPIRSRNMRRSNTRRMNFAPVGWRNAARAYDSDRNDDIGDASSRNRQDSQRRHGKSASDGIWKHDLFENDSEISKESRNL
ncbi:unnamed protein product [Dracunculus medinensis]|uniref:Btz domain-containing protein n=1 Tax=Dracunculus medinensis TaxID=318479 RepID=A0A0N4UNR7_DRAME|nr:unnamed protein product [Dracunculus medinensis]